MNAGSSSSLRFKSRSQCGILIENGRGELLLQLRDDRPDIAYPNCWGTFGGQIEAGELPGQAMLRELAEELAYRPEAFREYETYRCDGYAIHMFRCFDPAVNLAALQVREGQRAGFFSCVDLDAAPFAFNCREIVQDYFRRFHPEQVVHIGLGSNLGERENFLASALRQLGELMPLEAISSMYETEPVDYEAQGLFLNMVVQGRTRLFPQVLLEKLLGIEAALGRSRAIAKGPRTIDLDILLYADARIATRQLTIPHPRLQERGFVLEPLAEIAPGLVHPVLHKSIAALLAQHRPGSRAVRKTTAPLCL
jgi:2-amino-4-hydroxy-6-hydroxymethyldihydropteridine diphosphokinase